MSRLPNVKRDDLSPEDQKICAVFGDSYVFAGAVNFYRKQYDLPEAISISGSYYSWGPRNYGGELILTVNVRPESALTYCDDVSVAATHTHPFAREQNVPLCLCRKPKMPLGEFWPKMIDHRY